VNNLRNSEQLKQFGLNIKQIRESQNLSQEELCHRSGLSKNQIGNIERGEVNATLSTLFALSKGCNITISQIFKYLD
jgi:transcriptional regulator with XRE-family HTH domain